MASSAPVSNRPQRRPSFGVGEIFSRSFGVWFAQLPAFLLLTVLIFSPLVAYLWLAPEALGDKGPRRAGHVLQSIVLEVGGAILGSALAAAFSYGVFRRLQKQPAGMGECVARGLASLSGVLGVVLVRGLGIGLLTLPACYLGWVGIPRILLHIPSYWLAVVWSAAVPAAVIERLGVAAALERSTRLTREYRGSIFGGWILIGGGFVAGAFLLTLVGVQALRGASVEAQGIAILVVFLAVIVSTSSLLAVTQAVIYHGLRVRKEGVTADELIQAFE